MNPIHLAKISWGFFMLGIDLIATPRVTTIGLIIVLVAVDFITGIIKAKMNRVARTSEGFRKTLTKIMQYTIVPLMFWIGDVYARSHASTAPDPATMIKVANLLKDSGGWVMLFIIYIEITSIFENLYEIDKKNAFANIIRPILVILKFGIENNPFRRAADKLIVENKDVKVTVQEDKTDNNVSSKVTVEAKKPDES